MKRAIYYLNIFLLILIPLFVSQPGYSRVLVSFADIAAKAIPGVVNIRTTSYVARKDPSLDIYEFFLKGRIPRSYSSHSLGSGVIVDRKGYIITNHHVIKGANVIHVLFANSTKKLVAKVVGSDPKTDLALLYVKTSRRVRALDFGNSDKLRVGDVVLAIGNPFGFSSTVTSGIVSAKGRVIGTGPYDSFLQTDAAIHPGNSGGPLLDIRGRVIGINTAVSEKGQGIGFAIPINIAKRVIHDLKKYGKVRRPWIGVVGKNILSDEDVELNSGMDPHGLYGVIVSNLIVEGPAHKAGLKIGDIILAIDKHKVMDLNHFQRILTSKTPHDRVRLKLYRQKKGYLYLPVALKETPKTQDLPVEKDIF